MTDYEGVDMDKGTEPQVETCDDPKGARGAPLPDAQHRAAWAGLSREAVSRPRGVEAMTEPSNPLSARMNVEADGIPLAVRKFAIELPISTSLLYDLARRDETPEQKAERDAQYERWLTARGAFRDSIDGVADPHWRAVLDLHRRDVSGDCMGCDFGGYEGDPPEWPCRTVELAAEQCGIPIPSYGD